MIGLTSRIKDALNGAIEDLFDRIALEFIGEIPALKGKKNLVITSQRNFGLPHLLNSGEIHVIAVAEGQ